MGMTRLVDGLSRVFRLGAALALFFLMMLTIVDVVGRKFLGHSVRGGLELTELAMLVLIFAALPVATLAGQQIFFDLFDALLPPWARRWQVVLGNLLSASFLAASAWFVLGKAGNTREMGDITAQLAIAIAPFHYAVAALVLATALIHLGLAGRAAFGRDPGGDGDGSGGGGSGGGGSGGGGSIGAGDDPARAAGAT